MVEFILLDAVGAPAWALNELFLIIILSPFLLAIGIILFFKLLDRISKKDVPRNKMKRHICCLKALPLFSPESYPSPDIVAPGGTYLQ